MSYRNERLNRSMMSLEVIVAGITDVSKAMVFSDHGQGVDRMIAALDYDPRSEPRAEVNAARKRKDLLFDAEMQLVEAKKRHLIPVLLLIVENGSNRQESILSLAATSKNRNAARKRYFEHRDLLLSFFSEN